jgi:heme-degrading monooxygenase HmoA
MFIAMNRFSIAPGFEDAFEDRWRTRNSRLATVPGFRQLWLLRGEGGSFLSMTEWDTREDFERWFSSDAFRAGHSGEPPPKGMHLAAPEPGFYEVRLHEGRAKG